MKAETKQKAETTNFYEAWEVRRITNRNEGTVTVSFEKLKLLRPKVKISEDEANTCNLGPATHASNNIFQLYLKPGAPNEFDLKYLNITA